LRDHQHDQVTSVVNLLDYYSVDFLKLGCLEECRIDKAAFLGDLHRTSEKRIA
jgi:hypothetical protein